MRRRRKRAPGAVRAGSETMIKSMTGFASVTETGLPQVRYHLFRQPVDAAWVGADFDVTGISLDWIMDRPLLQVDPGESDHDTVDPFKIAGCSRFVRNAVLGAENGQITRIDPGANERSQCFLRILRLHAEHNDVVRSPFDFIR